MKLRHWLPWIPLSLLVACGGGERREATTTLSEDQKIYESITMSDGGGAYRMLTSSLPNEGAASSGDYVSVISTQLETSPSTGGPQQVQSQPPTTLNATTDPAVEQSIARFIQRYLVDGKIVKGSAPNFRSIVEYKDGRIMDTTLDETGDLVVSREWRYDFKLTELTGTVQKSPEELQKAFDYLFLNPQLLKATAVPWPQGAAYMTYTAETIDETYFVVDGQATTEGTDVSPLREDASLEDVLKDGDQRDGLVYTLKTGSISDRNGVRMYIASDIRPFSTTRSFRTYFELGGHVYIGIYWPPGTVRGAPIYFDETFSARYDNQRMLRFNGEAAEGLKSALAF